MIQYVNATRGLRQLTELREGSMKQRTYISIDLNNAEEKEMPISFGST